MSEENITTDEALDDLLSAFGVKDEPKWEDGWRSILYIIAHSDKPRSTIRDLAKVAVAEGRAEETRWCNRLYYRAK